MNIAFQRRTDLALAAMRALSETGPMPGVDLADRLGTTLFYLPQIMGPLVKSGWVNSVRGPGGGYQLTDEVGGASLLDVVEAVEKPEDGLCVLRDQPCPGETACAVHSVWTQAEMVLRNGLNDIPAVALKEKQL
jgi:Rrf2 family protein